ncbi:AP1AR [Bugula neritina]|uniref:AP1AR n=1 Tax=Bugula neritina TaxID=10212 RepID=A0A7J7IVG5_BUGNE|nr:AP1AR [Bugula neritina]
MGNCCGRCLNIFYKRRVLRQYTALDGSRAPDQGESLFDEDDGDGFIGSGHAGNSSSSPAAITENEKLLLQSKNYAAIISSQRAFDEQIDRQLAEQEEKLKREEEELLKLRLARSQQKSGSTTNKVPTNTESEVPWTGNTESSEWNVAGGEDDFDMFLDSIASRDKSQTVTSADDEINEEDFVSAFSPS